MMDSLEMEQDMAMKFNGDKEPIGFLLNEFCRICRICKKN